MNKLLLLHERHTPDDSDIWRAAVRRGWKTERTNMYKVMDHIGDHKYVRYYGNTLHARFLESRPLPFKFLPIDYSRLAQLREYTKRYIEYSSFGTLTQPIDRTLFIKPARDKWFEAKVYHPGNTIVGSPEAGDEIYISDVVSFENEIRCFVLDGEVLTSSLYRINKEIWDRVSDDPDKINYDTRINDTPIPQMVKEIYARGGLPRGVVMDFGTTRNPMGGEDQFSLIEFNEAWASGLYYCDPEKCFDVIEASQENKEIDWFETE